ncbi:MAG: cupin domain-containing protein, partial [Muribaculaceae bacterium]|nr:cupin domain-containing protein [Muribaculaceae bacterium]
CEISFGSLPTGEAVPFFHSHKENEENYIILSGAGKFQVNDNVFDIEEGSVIRVSTNCDRNIKCTSSNPLVYICIQAKEGSLGGYTMTDAEITERTSLL